jgi:hypothetical protein
MKQTKPSRDPETSPSRHRTTDRPDNGARSNWGAGPSSEVHKDNPHKHLKLARHASLLS